MKNLDGLLGYVKEYNPCFMGKDNLERAAHIILFAVTAMDKGYRLSHEIKNECRKEILYLKNEDSQILKREITLLKEYL